MSDHLARQPLDVFAVRDRLQRVRAIAMTPAERLTRMRLLIEASWSMLERNPDGLAHFRRRNFRARAIPRAILSPAESAADGT